MKEQPFNLLKEKVNKPLRNMGVDGECMFEFVEPIVCFLIL